MTPEQTVDLLTFAAAVDGREVGQADVTAWHLIIGDLDFADAQQALIDHYRESRFRAMPADVRQRAKAIRRDRLERDRIRVLRDPAAYRAELAAADTRVAQLVSNASRRLAIEAAAQRPAPEYMGPVSRRRWEDPQEMARRQVAESRARRESRDGTSATGAIPPRPPAEQSPEHLDSAAQEGQP